MKTITNKVEYRLKEYKEKYGENETTALLALIIQILAHISLNTENIANKLWE